MKALNLGTIADLDPSVADFTAAGRTAIERGHESATFRNKLATFTVLPDPDDDAITVLIRRKKPRTRTRQ